MNRIKVIGFDADDTLWVNEPYYRETEEIFADLLKDYIKPEELNKKLYATELKNMPMYGFGTKGFMLSLIETAIKVSQGKISIHKIQQIIELGHHQLCKPIELLPQVKEILMALNGRYKLIVATKGDLVDQERKLKESGLLAHFHHIEVMSDKKTDNYMKLIKHLDIKAEQFVMIGNSLKSDIIPVLALGAKAIHIPYHTTWIHEAQTEEPNSENYYQFESLIDILTIIE